MRWKRIVADSGRTMEEAKNFKREFSNLRLMMTRMSNKLSQKTGFDPSKVRRGGREGRKEGGREGGRIRFAVSIVL